MADPRHGNHPWERHAGHGDWRGGRMMARRMVGALVALVMIGLLVGLVAASLIGLIPAPYRWIAAGFSILVVVGVFLLIRRFFGRSFRPVGDLIGGIQRLGDGEEGVRVAIRRPGPLVPVINSFNRMAASLDEEGERRRRLMADLSHELRTPLTVVRGEVEAVLDGVHDVEGLRNVVDELDLMDRLLEDLRVLALSESGRLRLELEEMDLGDLIGDVIASFDTPIETQEIVVATEWKGPMRTHADPFRVHQVFSNLVSNAVRHMPNGGSLTIAGDSNATGVTVRVSDTGPGIPEEDLETVFDRFVRSSDSSGSGLGLSIARDLVEAHSGTIRAENGPGGGASFVVHLPSAG